MIYVMKCKTCNNEVEWMCSIEEYENRQKKCLLCNGELERDYAKNNISFTINGYSSANNYGLKKE